MDDLKKDILKDVRRIQGETESFNLRSREKGSKYIGFENFKGGVDFA